MIKALSSLQDLQRRIYDKAKAEPTWRFWGLYVHVCTMETLREASRVAKANNGAPGIDGVTFEDIEASGVEGVLEQIRDEGVCVAMERKPGKYMLPILGRGIPERTQTTVRHGL